MVKMEFSGIHVNVLNLVMSALQIGVISPDDLLEIANSGKSNSPTPIGPNAKAILDFALKNGLLESSDILDLVGKKENNDRKGAASTNARPLKARRPLPPDSLPGDWFCPECNNTNFARRKECNICKAPRPPPLRPLPRLERVEEGFWPRRETRPSWGPGPAAFPPRRMMGRAIKQETRPRPPAVLPGDWVCEQCGNTNFARRKQCNIPTCKAPKPQPFNPYFWTRERDEWAPPINRFGPGKRRRGDFEHPPARRPRPPDSNPGDWLCELCGNTNFARRTECNISTCRAPRPG